MGPVGVVSVVDAAAAVISLGPGVAEVVFMPVAGMALVVVTVGAKAGVVMAAVVGTGGMVVAEVAFVARTIVTPTVISRTFQPLPL